MPGGSRLLRRWRRPASCRSASGNMATPRQMLIEPPNGDIVFLPQIVEQMAVGEFGDDLADSRRGGPRHGSTGTRSGIRCTRGFAETSVIHVVQRHADAGVAERQERANSESPAAPTIFADRDTPTASPRRPRYRSTAKQHADPRPQLDAIAPVHVNHVAHQRQAHQHQHRHLPPFAERLQLREVVARRLWRSTKSPSPAAGLGQHMESMRNINGPSPGCGMVADRVGQQLLAHQQGNRAGTESCGSKPAWSGSSASKNASATGMEMIFHAGQARFQFGAGDDFQISLLRIDVVGEAMRFAGAVRAWRSSIAPRKSRLAPCRSAAWLAKSHFSRSPGELPVAVHARRGCCTGGGCAGRCRRSRRRFRRLRFDRKNARRAAPRRGEFHVAFEICRDRRRPPAACPPAGSDRFASRRKCRRSIAAWRRCAAACSPDCSTSARRWSETPSRGHRRISARRPAEHRCASGPAPRAVEPSAGVQPFCTAK